MTEKLNCLMLIDDDETTNFIHNIVIKKVDCAENVVIMQDGTLALDYLGSIDKAKYVKPDLIFLDINMPAMNGWEFLEEYSRLDAKLKGQVVIVMLTTSLNPDDEKRANKMEAIDDFHNKPLTREILQEVLTKHFGFEF